MKVKSERDVTQSCLTLSDPMDCSLPGSSVHGIFQARVLEWGAIAFSDFKIAEAGKIEAQRGKLGLGGHIFFFNCLPVLWGYPGGSVVKNPLANARATGDS